MIHFICDILWVLCEVYACRDHTISGVYLVFWDRFSLQNLTSRLGWLAIRSQWSTCLCFPRVTSTCHQSQYFLYRFWEVKFAIFLIFLKKDFSYVFIMFYPPLIFPRPFASQSTQLYVLFLYLSKKENNKNQEIQPHQKKFHKKENQNKVQQSKKHQNKDNKILKSNPQKYYWIHFALGNYSWAILDSLLVHSGWDPVSPSSSQYGIPSGLNLCRPCVSYQSLWAHMCISSVVSGR